MSKTNSQIQNKTFQIMKGKLYFVCSSQLPKNADDALYFNIDNELEYLPINQDFGPLNISCITQFVNQLRQLIENPQVEDPIYFHTCIDYKKYTNAILLISAYQLICLNKTPQIINHRFKEYKIRPFRDSSQRAVSKYECTIYDCLRAIQHSMSIQWYQPKKFKTSDYDYYFSDENGSVTQIIPQKIYACKIHPKNNINLYGNNQKTYKEYLPVLRQIGITTIISINEKMSVDQEIKKYYQDNDMNFEHFYMPKDIPDNTDIEKFLRLIQESSEKQKILVTCNTGLGKSYTLIGCFAIKHYLFNAREYIAWARLCRPGSIIGSQQFFLLQFQKQLFKKGQNSPIRKSTAQKIEQKNKREQFSSALKIKRSITLKNPVFQNQLLFLNNSTKF